MRAWSGQATAGCASPEAQGSLWSGAGWIEVRDADGSAGVAQAPRLARAARVACCADACWPKSSHQDAKPFPVALSLSRIEIADAGIQLPAAALGLGLPRLAGLRLTGEVQVSIPRLSLERGRIDGDATLQWRARRLGAHAGLAARRLRGAHSRPSAPTCTRRCARSKARCSSRAKAPGRTAQAPSFLATARVPAQHQEQLAPLLRLIAVERGAGIVRAAAQVGQSIYVRGRTVRARGRRITPPGDGIPQPFQGLPRRRRRN